MAAMDGTREEGLCHATVGPAYLMCSFDPSPAGEMRCVLEKRGNKRQSGTRVESMPALTRLKYSVWRCDEKTLRKRQRAEEVLPEPRSKNHFRQGKKAISPRTSKEHHIRYGPSTFGKESRVVHVRA